MLVRTSFMILVHSTNWLPSMSLMWLIPLISIFIDVKEDEATMATSSRHEGADIQGQRPAGMNHFMY